MQTTIISPISDAHSAPTEAERLGDQITELCSYLYAAEARLLTLIREFDEKECWTEQGFCSCAHWLNFKCGTAHHVEKLVSKYRSAKRVQDAAVAEEQYRDRELSHHYDHDGCLVIKARLPAEQGALIIKALEMAMEKDFVAGRDINADTKDQPIAARRGELAATAPS